MAVKKRKTLKGYGSRYGTKVRNRLQTFVELKNKKKQCPYCRAKKVKRLSAGIWNCKKCDSTFTGKAYDVKRTKIKEEVEDVEL